VVVVYAHVLPGQFVEGAVRAGEDDVARLQQGLELFRGLGLLEGHCVAVGRGSGGEDFDEGLHEGELNCLHGDKYI
jgi:hypothetical protein